MKKKLFIVINDLNYFFSHRLNIALEAEKRGYIINVIYGAWDTSSIDKTKLYKFNFQFIPIKRGSINPLNEIITLYRLWKFLSINKPDVLHLVTLKPCLYVGLICKILKFNSIIFAFPGLGIIFRSKNYPLKIIKFFVVTLLRFILKNKNSLSLFQNEDDQELFVKLKLVNKKNTRIINGSGVNLEEYIYTKENDGKKTVLFASRLLKDKGIEYFVNAANDLLKKNLNINFSIVGSIDPGNPNSISSQKLEKWKKETKIKFLGQSSKMSKIYQNSHIVCLPSFYGEGLPKTLVEAAASGRAVITTDHTGCRNAIIKDKTGILIPIKNSDILAEKIIYLIKNDNVRKSMGFLGRKFAEEQFCSKLIAEKHLKLYEEVSKKKY